MDIMELGAIGELVGGVAVIATLVFVGLQVRQSNDLERTETLRAFARDWSLAVVEPLREADSADLIRRGNGRFEDLEETGKVQFFGYYGQVFFLAQELFLLNARGRVDPVLVDQIDGVILSFLTMLGVEQWYDLSRAFMSPPFLEHLEVLRRSTTPVQMSDAYPAFVTTGRA